MKNLESAVKELEELVDRNIDQYRFPETKNNSIRINNILIRRSKNHGYVIVDSQNNHSLAAVYSKSGAIAFALAHLENKNVKNILFYDSIIEKNTNDSYFYNHSIAHSDQEPRTQALLNRLEESKYKITWAKQSLDRFILNCI
jgi:hypothetical protein